MTREPRPTFSLARMAWLTRLERAPAVRGRGRTGYDCMHLGWTAWVPREPGAHSTTHVWLEQLTDAGRAQLAAWRAAPTRTNTGGTG